MISVSCFLRYAYIFGFKITCGTVFTWDNKNRRNVIRFQDGFGESSLFSIQIGQFYIIPIFSSTSRDHFGSKKNPPVWIYIFYTYMYIYMFVISCIHDIGMHGKFSNDVQFSIESPHVLKEKDVKLWHSASLDPRFCSNKTPLRCQCRSRGGKPHTSYMFKHCKFPRGHTLLSQGGNNGNNGGQTVELVELGWFGDGWEEDIV